MPASRLFHVLVAVALAISLVLTVQEALATKLLTSQVDVVSNCPDLPSRDSLHIKVVNGMSVPYSEDGPTGIDGGLPALMDAYRACSW